MKFTQSSQPVFAQETDILIIPVFEGDKEFLQNSVISELDKRLLGNITSLAVAEQFKGKKDAMLSVQTHGSLTSRMIVLIGMGIKEKTSTEDIYMLGASAARQVQKFQGASVAFVLTDQLRELTISGAVVSQIVTGMILGNYSFDTYKKNREDKKDITDVLIVGVDEQFAEEIKAGETVGQAVIFARDLINESPSITTPTYLADVATKISHDNKNISLTILSRKEMEQMGMNALLAVARGSEEEPKFIHLTYKGGDKKTITLVGKGITFDTGGLSLKTANGMETMKLDMAGAAVVLAVFSVLTKLHPEITVHGLISATENMPGPHAIKPGDVVAAMNGKTIEILNTDAEGRVVLADAMSYAAARIKSDAIVDFATLTGACMIALGEDIAGLFSNNTNLTNDLQLSARSAGEKIWEMPLVEEYNDLLKSHVADLKNIGGKYGGAITGALFIQSFVPDHTPWVHLDIAGPSFAEKDSALSPHGGTGFGIRMIIEYLMNI